MSTKVKSVRDAAAEEYAKKSVPFECEDSEGLYVEEVYPSQIRSVAEIGFNAGIQWAITHDPTVLALKTELEYVWGGMHYEYCDDSCPGLDKHIQEKWIKFEKSVTNNSAKL